MNEYIEINGVQFHLKQAHEMGKKAFIEAHTPNVRDVAKVWDEIEKQAKKAEKSADKKTK